MLLVNWCSVVRHVGRPLYGRLGFSYPERLCLRVPMCLITEDIRHWPLRAYYILLQMQKKEKSINGK